MEGTCPPPPLPPPASYRGKPLLLDLVGGEERRCRSVETDGGLTTEVRCRSLDGVVHGRLAAFKAPPDDYEGRQPAQAWLYDVNGIDRTAAPSLCEGMGGPQLGQRCVSPCFLLPFS